MKAAAACLTALRSVVRKATDSVTVQRLRLLSLKIKGPNGSWLGRTVLGGSLQSNLYIMGKFYRVHTRTSHSKTTTIQIGRASGRARVLRLV